MSEPAEQRYGVVYFDPKGGTDGLGCIDWSFCRDVSLTDAEEIALSWERITGADRHPIQCVGVAPWRGSDELTAEDVSAALTWMHGFLLASYKVEKELARPQGGREDGGAFPNILAAGIRLPLSDKGKTLLEDIKYEPPSKKT